MGADLAKQFPEAQRTFEEADDTLGLPLSRLAWEGPLDRLTRTEYAQPALFTHSLAVYRAAREGLGEVVAAAGHSLGELSALAAANAYSFRDGLRLVQRRGELMARADEKVPGAMAAVLGLEEEAVRGLCEEASREGSVVAPANLNAKGQIVASGHREAVQRLSALAGEQGARRVVRLNVSAAFHSPLMAPVQESFREALEGIRIRTPRFPVVSNVTARASRGASDIRDLLLRQLTSPVRWLECVQRLSSMGAERFLELGPGKVLAALNRRNARGARTLALGDARSVLAFLKSV